MNRYRGVAGWSELLLPAAAAMVLGCGGSRTEEPVVSTARGQTAVSEAGTAAARRGKSLVRVVNAIPGDRTLDLASDDRTVFFDLAYRAVTPYTEIGDNVMQFRVLGGGTDSLLAENTETLLNGVRYTIVVLPDEEGKARIRVLRDDLEADSGKARLRLVHAAPALAQVDVSLPGQAEPLFNDLDVGSSAGFADVAPTRGALTVRQDDGARAAYRSDAMRLEPGRSYTIVLTGLKGRMLQTIAVTDVVRKKQE